MPLQTVLRLKVGDVGLTVADICTGIVPTIQNHEQAILYLAARVEQVKLRLDSLRYEYT